MKAENQKVVEKLNKLLADYQIYYQNLRGLHWNVKGAMFFMLHEKYEELYGQASEVIDEIAERILMVGGEPLHTFGDYVQTATLKEVKNVSDGKAGVEIVLENTRFLLENFNEIMEAAEEAGDEGTASLMSDWIGFAEKQIWMLESYLA
ncbi:DNA starvation/stationary phase protection protein [Maribellus comscasis]|uniref:DNA starvation/stationary phase protection protein n=1 Tax=Maribellus comscasis TaxID=2681766 RepID=A0A6I6JUT5_9BACT|nr:Dps family protein [Maribellus comscasis]QGY46301.1 DNA starvation/stationary phase protection protein [Maribellus comscasis]